LEKLKLQKTTANIQRHVVLVAPEVPWNTGNVGRTCLGTHARLHLIKPLGFSLSNRELKRSGLDYWPKVKLSVWENFEQFLDEMAPAQNEVVVFTKKSKLPFWQMPSSDILYLIFGSETKGLPETILSRYSDTSYQIPITNKIRCLNLSTCVGIALYESLRNVFHTPSAVIRQ
jgi:tRNA (cytidine/uridine-2'-O-)-methyltransferase